MKQATKGLTPRRVCMQFQIEIYSRETGTLRLQVLHKRVKDGINENLSFFPLQFKIEVVYAVDPKIMLDPILLGWKKQRMNSCQNVPSQQATTPSTA